MRTIEHTGNFKRDYKREVKGRSREYASKLDSELDAVVRILQVDGVLSPRFNDHLLFGEWKDHRDCHIRPDLLLIYRKPDPETLVLVRLGSHSELFR
jgi:mRNA interferase YafQ